MSNIFTEDFFTASHKLFENEDFLEERAIISLFSRSEILLYLFLLHLGNRYSNPFYHGDVVISRILGISRMSIHRARKKLKAHELIDYKSGQHNRETIYTINPM